MELYEVVRRRRMVRNFEEEEVAPAALRRILDAGRRAPSAGFTQAQDFVVLDSPGPRSRFWQAAAPGDGYTGVRRAPVLILVVTSEQDYLSRYAEPDKGGDSHAPRFGAPYWWVDAGMAAMMLLLAAVEEGLGALFFGVPPERLKRVKEAFGIPMEREIAGVVALGRPRHPLPRGSAARRARRPYDDVVHRDRW